jgi:hypothetical protein
MRPDKTFASIAFLILALVLGAYAWSHWIAKPRITTKIVWFEKPIFIEKKTESRVGVPASSTTHPVRDTSLATLPRDSTNVDSLRKTLADMRELFIEKTDPFTTTFEDTLAFDDSLISFRAREITTIDCDPYSRLITKTREFQDAILKWAGVTTTETTTEIDWLLTAAAFIAGMVLALLLS